MPAIAVVHEHLDWFRPLLAELRRRGLPYVDVDSFVEACVERGT